MVRSSWMSVTIYVRRGSEYSRKVVSKAARDHDGLFIDVIEKMRQCVVTLNVEKGRRLECILALHVHHDSAYSPIHAGVWTLFFAGRTKAELTRCLAIEHPWQ